MPTDNALEWIEDHVTLLFSLFSKIMKKSPNYRQTPKLINILRLFVSKVPLKPLSLSLTL